ncbi:MAG: ATP-dependent RecD-like DNA helicase [Lactovum sp.]
MNTTVYFTGKIEAIFFSNEANLYKVLLLQITDTDYEEYEDSEIVVTGTIAEVFKDENYTFTGTITSHPKYGEQLKVLSYKKETTNTSAGLISYLSSSKFPGIGKGTAQKIIDLYPKDTILSIIDAPEKLSSILSLTKKNSFLKNLSQDIGTETILSKLYSLGLSGTVAARIFKTYKAQSLDILKENPYQLVEDIEGIGFNLADKIAFEQGFSEIGPTRLQAALIYSCFDYSQQTGDSYIDKERLLLISKDLLESSRAVIIPQKSLVSELSYLINEEKLINYKEKIFSPSLFYAEESIANSLRKFLKRPKEVVDKKTFKKILKKVEEKLKISYDDFQKNAILNAIENSIFILTGGPGTGKTTIINGFLEIYAQLHKLSLDPKSYTNEIFPFVLAAPTGRASRRLNELTGLPTATLHRTLGIGAEDSEEDYSNELSGQLLIVDEFSMVDTWLAKKLFSAIDKKMKILIVGDKDQLASVGPGQILTDLLNFEDIPSIKLDKIYRQSEDSTISNLAHEIKNAQLPSDFCEKKKDRNFFESSPYQLTDLIGKIAKAWINKGKDPFDFQVLIPMYKGQAGITNVNKKLQNIFNPLEEGLEFIHLETSFRENDKVLQLVNQADKNVFNGDLGKIIELIPAKYSESKQDELCIDFEGQELSYPRSEWANIRLAYAMSIHKSQGSEFPTVIVPLLSSYSRMLQRNLLYTAITRAKSSLILLGEISAFELAVSRKGTDRNTFLLERLTENPEIKEIKKDQPKDFYLTQTLINDLEIPALIGLEEEDFEIFKNNSRL